MIAISVQRLVRMPNGSFDFAEQTSFIASVFEDVEQYATAVVVVFLRCAYAFKTRQLRLQYSSGRMFRVK